MPLTNNATNAGGGSTGESGGWVNYGPGYGGTGNSQGAHGSVLTISNTGYTTATGFTIASNFYLSSGNDWSAFLGLSFTSSTGAADPMYWSLQSGNTSGSNTSIRLYSRLGGDNDHANAQPTISYDAWYSYVLSFSQNDEGNMLVSLRIYDATGTNISDLSFTDSRGYDTLNTINAGKIGGFNSDNGTRVDNFSVYNAAANADQADMIAQSLTNNELAQTVIPEPSTTTLGLLSLAGLLLRRRRK